jgi:hypothetical protein
LDVEVRSDYETTLSIRSDPKWIFWFRNPNESDRIAFGSVSDWICTPLVLTYCTVKQWPRGWSNLIPRLCPRQRSLKLGKTDFEYMSENWTDWLNSKKFNTHWCTWEILWKNCILSLLYTKLLGIPIHGFL